SGGQKQRVAVARALMNQPALVLADEPTGNLDRESADQVMRLIEELNQKEGTTFLISTHDEKIAAYCRRSIRVVDGRTGDEQRFRCVQRGSEKGPRFPVGAMAEPVRSLRRPSVLLRGHCVSLLAPAVRDAYTT